MTMVPRAPIIMTAGGPDSLKNGREGELARPRAWLLAALDALRLHPAPLVALLDDGDAAAAPPILTPPAPAAVAVIAPLIAVARVDPNAAGAHREALRPRGRGNEDGSGHEGQK